METIFKYLKTIVIWILIVNFVVSAYLFSTNISDYLSQGKIEQSLLDSDLISNAESIQDSLDGLASNLKSTVGDDYPALGVVYYKTILHYSTEKVVQMFLFSLILGFGLGNIIYFIFVVKFVKVKLLFALTIAACITGLFFGLTDILTYAANGEEFNLTIGEIVLDMEVTAIPYAIVSVILAILNKVYLAYVEIRDS